MWVVNTVTDAEIKSLPVEVVLFATDIEGTSYNSWHVYSS